MSLPLPLLAATGIRQVIPERPSHLWLALDTGQVLLMDCQRLQQAHAASWTWESWSRVQLAPDGQLLSWADDLELSLHTIQVEAHAGFYVGMLQLMSILSSAALYRPLRGYLKPVSDQAVSLRLLLARLNIDESTLAAFQQHYPVSAALLHRRLLDLVLALSQAYSIAQREIHQLLRWHWHGSVGRSALLWPTPLAAIQSGDLHVVEANLYPHPFRLGRT
ncbi:DUF2442 domain-containing protein [Deinococcus aquatilis]|uniref:DUF2442 domain-containing protein n=1 Tax=Deinococcus aquatilis TaxID=519440 RepID=UPI0012F8C0B9|nr:DUF2442 domain-containing protein [Deinococcus aquatilis]